MADGQSASLKDATAAVVDLVPGDARFADLAERALHQAEAALGSLPQDDEVVRYLVPVVIPAETLAHGALLILPSRCVAAWRHPGSGQVRTSAAELDAETSVALSAVTLDSEIWGRFDVMRPGQDDLTFLVPPVDAVALPELLSRVLVREPGAHLVPFAGTPLGARSWGAETPRQTPDPDLTQPLSALDTPAPPALAAAPPPPRRIGDEVAIEVPLYRDEALYRDDSSAPMHPLPAIEPVAALPAQPPPDRPLDLPPVAPLRRGLPDALKGFLTGLVATLVVGGFYVLAQWQGWLG